MSTGQSFQDWGAFHDFSVRDFRAFWHLFLEWSDLACEGDPEPVCASDDCEQARFFPNLRLSYVENLLAGEPKAPAITARHGGGGCERITRGALRARVSKLAAALQALGVGPGDRVVCVARNNPEAIVASLASAALGAIFSSCGPEMGAFSMVSRFVPLAPVLMFANTRPEAWDMGEPLARRIVEAAAGLPSLRAVVGLDDGPLPETLPSYRIDSLIAGADSADLAVRRPFNHPLFAMFSSGTTGVPKCILHGAGGTLLEHVKEHRLHCDLHPGERLFYQTSCGWMMWNWQLSALASGVELVLYDGALTSPETLWQIVAEEQVNVFGTSPAYLKLCEDAGLSPRRRFDLGALRSVLSTGSILYPRQFDWAAAEIGPVPLQSISGGTDIIGCFVLGNPDLPVRRGEAQCRSLGLDVRALAEPGETAGELVCPTPFPSRPIGLWDDPDGARFHAAYFAQNSGVWTHGDLIEITESGGAVLHGRSDGVMKILGVRVGPAELYAILQDVPEIAEAMAVAQRAEDEPGGSRLVLLVVLKPGAVLDAAIIGRIREILRTRGSVAMVPGRILAVSALPETHNGKRSETAARAALNGEQPRNRAALRNPEVLEEIAAQAKQQEVAAAGDLPLNEGLGDALQALCERVLGVAPIGWAENLFRIRGDSLTSLGLLLEIERRTGHALPLAAMSAAPTIEGLAALLRGTAAVAADVHVRAATCNDIDAICALLQQASAEGTFEQMDATMWRRIFDYAWIEQKPDIGFVLAAGAEIVGFLGTIYALREINGKRGLVCNFTSWYVRPAYRGWGTALLPAALREGVTYTSLSPTPNSQQAFAMLGFSTLGTRRLWLPPGLHADTLRHRRPEIIMRPDQVRAALNAAGQRIFDDHAPYCLQLVVRDGAAKAHIVAKRRVRRRRPLPILSGVLRTRTPVPYSEILYCSNAPLLSRHLERIKLAILRRQKTLILVAAAGFFPDRPRGIVRKEQTLFRSSVFGAEELDRLYSEFPLLSF
jgi:acetoacetyl-CoA synthetase